MSILGVAAFSASILLAGVVLYVWPDETRMDHLGTGAFLALIVLRLAVVVGILFAGALVAVQ